MIKSSCSVRISFPVFMIFLNIIFGGMFMRSSNKLIFSALIMILTLVLISFRYFLKNFGGNIDWTQFSGQEIRLIMCEHWYTNGLKPIVSEFENKTELKLYLIFTQKKPSIQKSELNLLVPSLRWMGL